MFPQQAPLARVTLTSQVTDAIRDRITRRVLIPGERIDQYQLAEELGVSLVPVREALKALEGEGLVTIVPRRGAFAAEVSRKDLADLYSTRAILEGEASSLAVPRLREAELARLDELVARMRESCESQDVERFMRLNREFHMTIYGACDNRHLLQCLRNLWERSERYLFRATYVIENPERVSEEHRVIAAACRDRDPERARALTVAHIRHTQDALQKILSQDA